MSVMNVPSSNDRLATLERILEAESIVTSFQPICSIRNHQPAGVEALSRGVDPKTGNAVPAEALFGAAQGQDTILALDRLCRRRALEAFQPLHSAYPELALFTNFDAAIVDHGVVGSGHFFDLVQRLDLNPQNIVIEIIESRVHRLDDLQQFAQTYRASGFLFALDDVGAGYSTLERLPIIQPDVLKLDRGLLDGIEDDYYKQEVFTSLVHLGHRLGALVVIEGVETERQAMVTLELGADMLQGYYVAPPEVSDRFDHDGLIQRLDRLAECFKNHTLEQIAIRYQQTKQHGRIARRLCKQLRDCDPRDFNAALEKAVQEHPQLECAYVLDESGTQISNTVFRGTQRPRQRQFVYGPAEVGHDHSLKDFFLQAKSDKAPHLTEPYVSLASGRVCKTLSLRFTHRSAAEYVLCLDLGMDETLEP